MDKSNYTIFSIDLTNNLSIKDWDKFLTKTNIKMDPKILHDAHNGRLIPCCRINKLLIDSYTLNIIAMESGQRVYHKDYSSFLNTVEPIDSNFSYGRINGPYSVICIDFREFDSQKDFTKFVNQTGLDIDPQSWYQAYLGTKIPGVNIFKVWIDAITLDLIKYQSDPKWIHPHEDFDLFMKKLKPIDSNFKFGNFNFRQRDDLTIDSILDKIIESGISSLTPFEKDFLDKNSKN